MNRHETAALWPFEKQGILYLNHGSFGAVPLPVQAAEDRVRQRLRENPFDHLVYEHGGLWSQRDFGLMEENRRFLAGLVLAEADGFVLTRSATDGVNAVFRSLQGAGFFRPGDEILVTRYGYNACNNVARLVAAQTGAKVVEVNLPFPVESAEEIRTAIATAVTDRTRFAMVDHISSIQAVILPIAAIVADMKARDVPILVDGAHALAQVPLALDELGADFYVGNCHKWFCAPPGTGFLSVAEHWREKIVPTVVSHGYNDPSEELPPLVKMFAWTGTEDYSGRFVLKETHAFLDSLSPKGLWGVVAANRALVREGYGLLLDALGEKKPLVPDALMGTMATVLLPPCDAIAVKKALWDEYNIITQLQAGVEQGRSILRISAHAYNTQDQYQKLARVLPDCLRATA